MNNKTLILIAFVIIAFFLFKKREEDEQKTLKDGTGGTGVNGWGAPADVVRGWNIVQTPSVIAATIPVITPEPKPQATVSTAGAGTNTGNVVVDTSNLTNLKGGGPIVDIDPNSSTQGTDKVLI